MPCPQWTLVWDSLPSIRSSIPMKCAMPLSEAEMDCRVRPGEESGRGCELVQPGKKPAAGTGTWTLVDRQAIRKALPSCLLLVVVAWIHVARHLHGRSSSRKGRRRGDEIDVGCPKGNQHWNNLPEGDACQLPLREATGRGDG